MECLDLVERQVQSVSGTSREIALRFGGAVWLPHEPREIVRGTMERNRVYELTISPHVQRRAEALQHVGNRLLDEQGEPDRQLVVRRLGWVGLNHLAVTDARRRSRRRAEIT
ncbi:MAG TPA: hypothetical protein VMW56_00550 [Candidatus Margulisiibacteriota bacterium]|nr:hypothetical protein [Candidatus Margulisiibacteriota bacterium]